MSTSKMGETVCLEDLYLTFLSGASQYAIPISFVERVIYSDIEEDCSDSPRVFRGKIKYCNEDLPVLDVRVWLEGEKTEPNQKYSVILVTLNGIRYGLVVDMAVEILWNVRLNSLPSDSTEAGDERLAGILETGSGHIPLLSPIKMLSGK